MYADDNDVWTYVLVYPRHLSLFLLCMRVCVHECVTGKQWLMSGLLSSVRWSVPEANERAPAFSSAQRGFGNTAKTAHEALITAGLSNHELNGARKQPLSQLLSLGAARLTCRPLPNPQHPREVSRVVLRQHKLKFVVQHYSLCVNMGIAKCGHNAATLIRPVMLI